MVLYTAAQQSITGFTPGVSPSYWDSGTQTGPNQSLQVGVVLTNSTTFYAYVIVTETGGEMSAWESTSFTVSFDPCATPTVTAVAGTDPSTGCPRIAITVQGQDNLLSFLDASFEAGTGSWEAGSNTTIADSATVAKDGSYSMKLTPTTSGALVAGLSPAFYSTYYVSVTALASYTVQAAFRAGVSARSCNVEVDWYTSGGSLISQVLSANVTDSTSAWTIASENVTAPATAASARILVNVASVSGSSDVHYVDCVGLQPGTGVTWTRGGLVGTTNTVITRSDGLYVRGASPVNPASFPTTVSLVDSGPNTSNLTINNGMTVVASNGGAVFGQAAYASTGGGFLQGPSGTGAANGAIVGSAFQFDCLYTMGATSTLYQIIASRYSSSTLAFEWQLYVNPSTATNPNSVVANMSNASNAAFLAASTAGLTPGVEYEISCPGTARTCVCLSTAFCLPPQP